MASFGSGPTVRPDYNRGGSTAPKTTERMNRYGAKCVNCGGWVVAGTGRLTNTSSNGTSGAWVVSHIPPCPEPNSQTEPVNKLEPTDVKVVPFSIPDGCYTVAFGDGHKTIRVKHQDEFDEFLPGKVLLGYLVGSNNDRDYKSFAHARDDGSVSIWRAHQSNKSLCEAVKVLLGDPKAASKAYALSSGCCGVCGRTLTTPESISAGIGPVCRERTGW